MRRKLYTLALLAISATAILAGSPAEAQVVRHRVNQNSGWYTLPNGGRMYPAPRYYYQFGGTRIYPGRGFNNSYWPYGVSYWPYSYSSGYNWSYGYPSTYVWPYGRGR